MAYDYRAKKTVIALASNMDAGKAVNVVGHLALSIGHRVTPDDMGKDPLLDATGYKHRGISKYPVIVTKVKMGRLKKLVTEARNYPDLLLVDYPEAMLETGHDDDLASLLESTEEDKINYLGVALHGDTKIISDLTGKFMLWGD